MSKYKVVGTNRTTGQNDVLYEGDEHQDCATWPKKYSAIQYLENNALVHITFQEDNAHKPWWTKIF